MADAALEIGHARIIGGSSSAPLCAFAVPANRIRASCGGILRRVRGDCGRAVRHALGPSVLTPDRSRSLGVYVGSDRCSPGVAGSIVRLLTTAVPANLS